MAFVGEVAFKRFTETQHSLRQLWDGVKFTAKGQIAISAAVFPFHNRILTRTAPPFT